MRKLFLFCQLVLMYSGMMAAQASAPALAQSTQIEQDAKRSEIRKLIELTGAANVSTDVLRQVIEPLRSGFPQVPDEFWDSFMKEVRADDLIDLIVPIYDRYYTRDDIRDLTRFYQSPVGQKTIKILPKLSAEAINAGQEWGKGVADRAMRKLKEQGYDKTSSMFAPPASPPKSASE